MDYQDGCEPREEPDWPGELPEIDEAWIEFWTEGTLAHYDFLSRIHYEGLEYLYPKWFENEAA